MRSTRTDNNIAQHRILRPRKNKILKRVQNFIFMVRNNYVPGIVLS